MSTERDDSLLLPPVDAGTPGGHGGAAPFTAGGVGGYASARPDGVDDFTDTVDLRPLAEEFAELLAHEHHAPTLGPGDTGLLDDLASWGPVATPVGPFQLVPVRIERDLPLVTRWMNDPAVAAFWNLSGPDATAGHLRAQLEGDGRSVPCLGVLGGVPMSYWEVYRADLDPIARYYPSRPHDTGIHLVIGKVADRGRGLGTHLLRTVADLVLDRRPSCDRVIAEPDLRNTPCLAAFLGAGFRLTGEVELPDKLAALIVRDRCLRWAL
ncbi:siderophore biosynthesis protein [Streptomyces cinnamoneus]|uniref:Lysine N-acyltransferase MbtK n=1 Tax=Streptomyces cinnamoneus TaxID=53446 RepID=A0A2G1X9B3_STRCJ|nr:GNAT family N-acetyltransferase [Streptomyces cinnamoneus]PHQ47824.1 siderophore biosynthesis protein [Streptomyces cinnamoneus]PPT15449.1 N-acetyltransferase [Streptomyces cinnamoneus]